VPQFYALDTATLAGIKEKIRKSRIKMAGSRRALYQSANTRVISANENIPSSPLPFPQSFFVPTFRQLSITELV
jgi:hypothetical protein